VDLGGALRLLAEWHRVGATRVDTGGGLNGTLLRAGLADQLSIVIAPYLAARAAAGPLRLVTAPGSRDAVALDLTAEERLRQGHVWLRYDVLNRSNGHSGGRDRATHERGEGRQHPGGAWRPGEARTRQHADTGTLGPHPALLRALAGTLPPVRNDGPGLPVTSQR